MGANEQLMPVEKYVPDVLEGLGLLLRALGVLVGSYGERSTGWQGTVRLARYVSCPHCHGLQSAILLT